MSYSDFTPIGQGGTQLDALQVGSQGLHRVSEGGQIWQYQFLYVLRSVRHAGWTGDRRNPGRERDVQEWLVFFHFLFFVWVRLLVEVVAQQFKRSWRHTTPCPKVRAIYKIVLSQQILDKYDSYRFVTTLSCP